MMSVVRRWLAVALIAHAMMFGVSPAHAVQPDEILANSALEQRARALSRELRCMVCQNQSIDDSDAPLARDLRLLVRERLTAGDSDTQVIDHLTDRYGPFVLLKPQWGWSTLLLWLTPAAVFIIGALAMVMRFRRRGALEDAVSERPEPALSAAEEARLMSLRAGPSGSADNRPQATER